MGGVGLMEPTAGFEPTGRAGRRPIDHEAVRGPVGGERDPGVHGKRHPEPSAAVPEDPEGQEKRSGGARER